WVGMGWYPGMVTYGGMWSYHPWASSFLWMPGFMIHVGGARYDNWGGYRNYYASHPGYVRSRVTYNYTAARPGGRTFSSSAFRSSGSVSAGGRFGNATTSTGSFGSARRFGSPVGSSFGRSSGSFGGSSRTGGSFGGFGGIRNSDRPTSSFG